MVCCASYWARQEVDEAGRVGSGLQKILFFLSALTVCTFFTFNPMTVLGSMVCLMVMAVGIHGAQKRNTKALFFYGSVTLCSVITVVVTLGFVCGFMLMGGAHVHRHAKLDTDHANTHFKHWQQSSSSAMHEHFVYRAYESMERHGFADMVESENNHFDHAAQRQQVFAEPQAYQEGHREIRDIVDNTDAVRNVVHKDNAPTVHRYYKLTPLGYVVTTGLFFFGLVIFALKVRTIRLAFHMRRLLLAARRQSLPHRMGVVPPAPIPRPVNVSLQVHAPSGPMPSRRRDCARCTYMNVAGAARCAMCDSQLPFAAAPSTKSSAPRIYTPGQLPLNQPLN